MVDFMYLTFMCLTFHQACGQFQEHIDLQKISEITFRNEKYNVLKPTVHVIRDHFNDYIQKRNSDTFPTDRVFLDKNGFRHFWKGMEIPKRRSLRKTDLSEKAIELKSVKKERLKSNKKEMAIVKARDRPKRKKKLEADIFVPVKPNLRENSVFMKTTFFCPFFGVITMSTNVENNFEELKDIAR